MSLMLSCAAQDYNARKVLERGIKGIAHDSNAISVAPPDLYANRFFAFNSNVRPGAVTNWGCNLLWSQLIGVQTTGLQLMAVTACQDATNQGCS